MMEISSKINACTHTRTVLLEQDWERVEHTMSNALSRAHLGLHLMLTVTADIHTDTCQHDTRTRRKIQVQARYTSNSTPHEQRRTDRRAKGKKK